MPYALFLYAANMLPLFSRSPATAFNKKSQETGMTPSDLLALKSIKGALDGRRLASVLSLPGPVGQ